VTQRPETLLDLTRRISDVTGGRPDLAGRITVTGPRYGLPSRFDVTGLAVASVGAATLAAAEFLAARNAGPGSAEPVPPVTVDSRAACAAFAAEGLFTPVGWSRPELWDPIAGNYQAADGWIRLHTNYAYHRAAAERVLGANERDAVAAAVRRWNAADLEAAVVAAGGCAAVMHSRDAWLASAAGAAANRAPVLSVAERPVPAAPAAAVPAGSVPAGRPFAGIRVLDLTRVIAGPACTRFLAAYGADVLRVDPPGFAEVPALLPETTAGKRTTFLDLRAEGGRATFEALLAEADVLVTGLRGGALARLGYDDDTLARHSPALVHASLNAYGWAGPWRERRGFDSLVQMSSGIAAAEAGLGESGAAGSGKPAALPVQALDHGCGYLLAARVGRGLTRRLTAGVRSQIRGSLAGTAKLLWSLPGPEAQPPDPRPAQPQPAGFTLVDTVTAWGPARRAAFPGSIAGAAPVLEVEAGPLGRHDPEWAAR
jgi:hypothetical protein